MEIRESLQSVLWFALALFCLVQLAGCATTPRVTQEFLSWDEAMALKTGCGEDTSGSPACPDHFRP